LAEEKCVGLVLVNRNEAMTPDSYIVQRSIEDYAQWQCDMEVLKGQRDMTTTLMIYDSQRSVLTSSLSDWLLSEHIGVKPSTVIKALYLTNDNIESKADELTRHQVEEQKRRLTMLCGDINKKVLGQPLIYLIDLEIDPFIIAKELGISYIYTNLPNEQLGYLEVNTGTIYLKPFENNYHRDRFTIAHELGHYQLHLSHFRKYNYTSVGESYSTINDGATVTTGELKWLEHHANHFAACLLMPKELVLALYIKLHCIYLQQRYGDKLAPLYYNPKQGETLDSYHNIVERMAKILNVSTLAMHYRLKNLGILNCPADN
jgi:Zn-dependent peptidase ImmA (M78 family)